jgi:diadenosine tetraphosphatase ApaH/serine/threonine PP2A family protein phosphatase
VGRQGLPEGRSGEDIPIAARIIAVADGYDRLLVLGDLVGYCAQPNEVVNAVRSLRPYAIVRGNHDKVASGVEQPDAFNPVAQQAATWTFNALTPENRAYLATCAEGPLLLPEGIEICHGSPVDEDLYITSEIAALRALKCANAPVCFYGHTHIPVRFALRDGNELLEDDDPDGDTQTKIRDGWHYLINPGSVGQPRDGDPRAAFAIFDVDAKTIHHYRTDYPVERAQQRIIDAGLPHALARRLALGR